MSYSLDAFCEDCRTALKADPGPGGREAVRQKLEQLLAESAFLDRHVLSARWVSRTPSRCRRGKSG